MENKHSELVRKHFNKEYQEYDKLIKKIIPKYEEMNKLVINNLKFPQNAKLKILDLGIGTGQTSLKILRKFSNAEIVGFDISRNMIKQAKLRLKGYLDKVKFYNKDIINANFTKKYNGIVSVLCIHHLNSKQKQEFFKKIHKTLEKGGIFIIADIIKFDTIQETTQKEKKWQNFLIKNLGKKEGDYWFRNYQEEDLPDSVNNQLKWLKAANFTKAHCVWKYMNCAVISAKKLNISMSTHP